MITIKKYTDLRCAICKKKILSESGFYVDDSTIYCNLHGEKFYKDAVLLERKANVWAELERRHDLLNKKLK